MIFGVFSRREPHQKLVRIGLDVPEEHCSRLKRGSLHLLIQVGSERKIGHIFLGDHRFKKSRQPNQQLPQEVWLSLSEAGQNGSNVRAGPGTDNQVLSVVSGDAQVLYLEERSGRWVRVRRICMENPLKFAHAA